MAEELSKLSMRLFGLPYQFPASVDPRVNDISTTVGKKFTENILAEAPVCTFVPGTSVYLPGEDGAAKMSTAEAIIKGAGSDFSDLRTVLTKDGAKKDVRLYDFKNAYTEYMSYVNILCRTGAAFLGINETLDGVSLTSYDWKKYKWNSDAPKYDTDNEKQSLLDKVYETVDGLSGNTISRLKTFFSSGSSDISSSLDALLTSYNYIQFYVDADVGSSDSLSNSTGESSLKSALDSGSQAMKEVAFMANSGGVDTETISQLTESASSALEAGFASINNGNGVSGAISRIINLGSDVLKGNNIILPDIYQSSSYQKSYSITVHLKTPYGTPFGYFMDIFVPMMHLLALAMPKQESANSFSSPFLVKAYVEGIFSCSLGIVDSISISRISDSWSTDGLPTEVDVNLNITDLYSDLTMAPSTSPFAFVNNSSLLEFLATNCGLSLIKPQYRTKYKYILNSVKSSLTDIPSNVSSKVNESIYNLISSMTSLY